MTNHLFATLVVALACVQSTPELRPDGGTDVLFDQATTDIFPKSWLTEKIDAKAEALAEGERARCQEITHNALAKYPPGFLKTNLKKIYWLGGLEYSGARTGGTNSRTSVYVVCKPLYRSFDVEKNLHAEFSSIVLRNFAKQFDSEAWMKINPTDFRYGNGGVQAVLDNKASTRVEPSLLERGFLTQYSQASMEEDFNSIAGRIFMGDSELWDAVEKHPRIRSKVEQVMGFYLKLDEHFSAAYFDSLRPKR